MEFFLNVSQSNSLHGLDVSRKLLEPVHEPLYDWLYARFKCITTKEEFYRYYYWLYQENKPTYAIVKTFQVDIFNSWVAFNFLTLPQDTLIKLTNKLYDLHERKETVGAGVCLFMKKYLIDAYPTHKDLPTKIFTNIVLNQIIHFQKLNFLLGMPDEWNNDRRLLTDYFITILSRLLVEHFNQDNAKYLNPGIFK